MFSLVEFKKALKEDNPTYERMLKSDLHSVVAMVSKPGYSAQQLSAEIKKVTNDKWKKYPKSRAYLVANIAQLSTLLSIKLTKFKTRSMVALPGGNIKHDAVWESDSGLIQDLSAFFVREKVFWGDASAAAAPQLDPAYRVAGQHFGQGNAVTSPGSAGEMTDTHDAKGAFAPSVLNYTGPAISYTCDQVYQYSDNNKASWKDIPNSNFRITRTATPQPNNVMKFTILKTNILPNPIPESQTNSVLL